MRSEGTGESEENEERERSGKNEEQDENYAGILYYALRSPILTNYIHRRRFFLVGCGILDLETPCLAPDIHLPQKAGMKTRHM